MRTIPTKQKNIQLYFWSLLFLIGISTSIFGQAYKTTTPDQLIQQYLQVAQPEYAKSQAVQYRLGDDMFEQQTNIRRIYARQEYQGIEIKDAMLSLHYAPNDKMVKTDDFVEVKINTTQPILTAEQAVRAAMLEMGGFPAIATIIIKHQQYTGEQNTIFDKGQIAADDMMARLIFVENKYNRGQYLLAWETQLFTKDRQHYWLTYIDATSGKLLEYQDLVLHCSFGGEVTDASPEEQKQIDYEHHLLHLEAAKKIEAYLAQKEQMINAMPLAEPNIFTTSMMAPAHKYRVLNYPAEAPNDSSVDAMGNPINVQTLVTTAGDPVASPYGWNSVDGTAQLAETNGNNVYAFYDPSPGPLGGAPQPLTSAKPTVISPNGAQTYDYPWDLTKEPEFSQVSATNQFPNRNAAIVNLFYWNNLVHDMFYGFGFTEAGRNFQQQNSFPTAGIGNRGGQGNDHVLAQAQDAGGVNNANFLTLADGVNGQMQMYLWTAAVIDEIVKIQSGSLAGMQYEAIQGAMYANGAQNLPNNNLDLNARPLINKQLTLINTNGDNENNTCNATGTEGCGTGQQGIGQESCNNIAGKIALIDRGTCSFAEKVHGAQLSDAVGVIVINNNTNSPNEIIAMGGADASVNTITIPAVMVSYNTGLLLKAAVAAGPIFATLSLDAPAVPKKDGDFDNGIIAHEYGHGISTRTSPQTATGGSLSGSEQGGEGWSDYWALYMTTTSRDLIMNDPLHPNGRLPDRGIGSYIRYTNDSGPGIRPRQYSVNMITNEFTYAKPDGDTDVAGATPPHGVGFIWCTMLYELTQKMIDVYGFNNDLFDNGLTVNSKGNNIANRLILEGIKHQSAGPTFVSQRDGILRADQLLYNGANQCHIWEAFAKRGLGAFASSGSNAQGDEVESFDLPAECGTGAAFITIDVQVPTLSNNGSVINYVVTVKNATSIAAQNIGVELDIPANFGFSSATNGGTNVAGKVVWTIPSISGLGTQVLTASLSINTPTTTNILFRDEMETTENWTQLGAAGTPSDNWRLNQLEPYSGNNVWFVPDPDNVSNQVLTMSPAPTARAGEKLVFVHKFATEKGFDVGIVEVSTDGGATYNKLPPTAFSQGGYNDQVAPADNPVVNGPAFGGGSGGYIFSIADLDVTGGEALGVQFRFSADVLTPATGWWVDDVMICTNPTIVSTDARASILGGTLQTATATTIVTAGVLPIDLVELSATPQESNIRLDWTTATETNNKGFAIERRAVGETAFTKIGFVKSEGDSPLKTAYSFLDENVKANITYYYRLQQQDLNGQNDYSKVVSAMVEKGNYEVTLVPNPTQGMVYLEWTKNLPDNYQVEVFSVNGQLLQSQQVENGGNRLQLDLGDYPANIYFVKIRTENTVMTHKVILE